MDKEIRLKKIPLHSFIETLIIIYERGAEYIDIIGVPDKEQDSITIVVTNDYLEEEEEEALDGEKNVKEEEDNEKLFIPKPNIRKGLTDDDISSLT
tara:strand:+ start:515 stop:802 length:288 start_codon:yes stop_codon:yes gene_type:complete